MANKATILNGSAHKGKQRQKKETTQPVHKETGISSEKMQLEGKLILGVLGTQNGGTEKIKKKEIIASAWQTD